MTLQLAQELKASGLDVFPCTSDKAPAIKKGEDWREVAKRDPTTLRWGSGVVGVPVPSGVAVLDVDTYKGVSLEHIEKQCGVSLPWADALFQRTLHGGEHYAFRAPDWPVKNAQNVICPGVDSRAAGRGYIATGKGYTSVGPGVHRLVDPANLPPLPDQLRQWLERVEHKPASANRQHKPVTTDTIREALRHIDPGCDRDQWRDVGMAIKNALGDDPEGEYLFDQWSCGALHGIDAPVNYVPEHVSPQYASFKADKAGGITAGTLLHKALENGWRPSNRLDLASVFGASEADSMTFDAVASALESDGGNARCTQSLVSMIANLPCEPLQRSLLGAILVRELKEANLYTPEVRKTLGKVITPSPSKPAPPVPIQGQVVPLDQPLHDSVWHPMHTTGTREIKPLGSLENFMILISAYGINVSYNVIEKEGVMQIPGVSVDGPLRDDALLNVIESVAEINKFPHQKALSFISYVASKNLYNPVYEYVYGMPWDGRDHVGQLFNQLQLTPDQDTQLAGIMFRKWLRAAVAAGTGRVAGCELVLVLVEEGGGVGKSRFVQTLAPHPLVKTDVTLNVSDKDEVKQAISAWIVELGEINSTLTRSETNHLKTFLGRKVDEIRAPYGRTSAKYQRMTAFIGTVNDKEFLIDSSNNRRFLPIQVSDVNYRHNVNTQQVWAQAAAECERGKTWYFEPHELARVAENNTSNFKQLSAVEDMLSATFANTQGAADKHMTVTQVLKTCGLHNPNKRDLNDAGKWLRKKGYDFRVRNGVRGFMVPDITISGQVFSDNITQIK